MLQVASTLSLAALGRQRVQDGTSRDSVCKEASSGQDAVLRIRLLEYREAVRGTPKVRGTRVRSRNRISRSGYQSSQKFAVEGFPSRPELEGGADWTPRNWRESNPHSVA